MCVCVCAVVRLLIEIYFSCRCLFAAAVDFNFFLSFASQPFFFRGHGHWRRFASNVYVWMGGVCIVYLFVFCVNGATNLSTFNSNGCPVWMGIQMGLWARSGEYGRNHWLVYCMFIEYFQLFFFLLSILIRNFFLHSNSSEILSANRMDAGRM